MGVGPFSSSSNAKQISIDSSAGGQTAYGRAVQVNPDGVYVGPQGSLNTGVQYVLPRRFHGNITIDASTPQASSDPALIAALASLANNNSSPAPVTPPAATTPGASPTPDTRSLGQKISDSVKDGLAKLRGFVLKDNTDGTTTINTEALLFIAVFAVIFFLLKKFVFRK